MNLRLVGSRGRYPYNHGKHLYAYVTRRDIVYGDESGNDDVSPYMIVAGYIGAPTQWDKFDAEWRAVLGDIPAFHAKEFFPYMQRQQPDSRYYQWSDEELLAFIGKLLAVIDWHKILPTGAGVNTADFNAQPRYMRQYVTSALFSLEAQNGVIVSKMRGSGAPKRPPYMASLTMLMFDAINHARPDSRIEFYLDENTDNAALANEMFQRLHRTGPDQAPPQIAKRVGDLHFAHDEKHPGIQAADLYCYMWNARLSGRTESTPLLSLANSRVHRKRDDLIAIRAEDYAKINERIIQRFTDIFNERPS